MTGESLLGLGLNQTNWAFPYLLIVLLWLSYKRTIIISIIVMVIINDN